MNLNRPCKIVLVALLVAQHFLAGAQTTNALAPADYPKFIAQRNIFDPNRYPFVPGAPPRPVVTRPQPARQPDSFSLVGIIGYGEGRLAGVYAFFNGSSSQYQKTAQLNDSIAGFKVADISANSVTLVSGTNKFVLQIGEQLQDDGSGHWVFANGTTSRYSNGGNYTYSSGGRYSNRGGGFGNGNRRRNNFGNGNNGNYNNSGGFNNRNFSTGGNNFAGSAATSDNSQADDQSMNSQNDNAAPDDNIAPDNNMAPPDDNAATDAGAQDTTAPPTDSNDPLAALKAARAAELQQIGH